MRGLAGALAGLAVLALAGCTLDPPRYQPPALPPESAAIITGSHLPHADPLAPDTRAYLYGVDKARTYIDPRESRDERTALAPGLHEIVIGVLVHGADFPDAVGFVVMPMQVDAGKSYVIRSSETNDIGHGCRAGLVWIESDDGTATAKLPVTVAPWNGEEFMSSGGGFASLGGWANCP